jgi:hypothetical protein
MPDYTDEELIERWRRRAAAMRATARSMDAGERRDALFRLAELYDQIADTKGDRSGGQGRLH